MTLLPALFACGSGAPVATAPPVAPTAPVIEEPALPCGVRGSWNPEVSGGTQDLERGACVGPFPETSESLEDVLGSEGWLDPRAPEPRGTLVRCESALGDVFRFTWRADEQGIESLLTTEVYFDVAAPDHEVIAIHKTAGGATGECGWQRCYDCAGGGNAYGDWSGDPTLALRCDATVVLTAQDFGAPVSETVCGDGGDGDLDGLPDCTDPDCADAAVCQATCVFDGRPDEASWTARGTTAGHPSVVEPSCALGPTGAEALVHFTAPSDGQWRFSTRDSRFRTLLSAFDRCGGKELACSVPVWVGDSLCVWEADYSAFTLPLVAGQEVVLVVDGRTVDQRGEWMLTAELL